MANDTSLFSRILGYFIFFLNLIAILWLLGCYAASFINPQQIVHIALLSLTTPFAIAANALFVLIWLFSARKLRFLWSFITLIVCYKIILQVFGFHFFTTNDFSPHPNTFKVMSWNVHGMGVFDKPRKNDHADRIIASIKDEQPDILSLIEYPTGSKDTTRPTARRIIKELGYAEYRYNTNDYIGNNMLTGIGIFSKFPVSNYKTTRLNASLYLLQWDVTFANSKTIRMFFLHLSSFSLSDADRALIDTMKANHLATETQIKRSRSFIQKFDINYINRAKETAVAMGIINSSPYPVLICGDFNDLPGSYAYTQFRGDRHDVFIDKGVGIERTYNQVFPTIRIDHMFYDAKAMKVLGYKVPTNYASDHNPVIANFEVR